MRKRAGEREKSGDSPRFKIRSSGSRTSGRGRGGDPASKGKELRKGQGKNPLRVRPGRSEGTIQRCSLAHFQHAPTVIHAPLRSPRALTGRCRSRHRHSRRVRGRKGPEGVPGEGGSWNTEATRMSVFRCRGQRRFWRQPSESTTLSRMLPGPPEPPPMPHRLLWLRSVPLAEGGGGRSSARVSGSKDRHTNRFRTSCCCRRLSLSHPSSSN